MTLPSFIRALSFPLLGRRDRFLFADAFITDDAHGRRLVLVSTFYPDVTFDFGEIAVTVAGSRRTHFDEVGVNVYEPSRAINYRLDDLARRASYDVQVRYEGRLWTARIAADRPVERPEFTLATLFKGDHRNIEAMYRYYRGQGVERFYLFYNGDISRVSLFQAPEITYGEWDFRYWLHANEPPFNALLVDRAAVRNHHHAQAMFLTMVRFRILSRCSYLALVDLDELLAVPGDSGETVRTHVERVGALTLSARGHWTEIRTATSAAAHIAAPARVREYRTRLAQTVKRVVRRLGVEPPEPVIAYADLAHLYANARPSIGRGKTVYRGDYSGLFGIHRPKSATLVASDTNVAEPAVTSPTWNPSDELKLFHLVNTTHARHDRIDPDALPLSLLPLPAASSLSRKPMTRSGA